jgi:hypothetical protein
MPSDEAAGFRDDIAGFREELRSDLAALRGDFGGDFTSLRSELRRLHVQRRLWFAGLVAAGVVVTVTLIKVL